MSRLEPTHFVLPRGTNSMVKVADFFRSQGGDREAWGRRWIPVHVDPARQSRRDPAGIELARRLGAHLPPIERIWCACFPLLDPADALDPSAARYQQVADRGLLP